MSEQLIRSSKKSSRLNSKKQEKVEIYIDKAWIPIVIDLIVSYEQKLNDHPKCSKGVQLYRNTKGEIIANQLADYLKLNEIARQQSSVSFWDERKQIYVFGFSILKDVKQITKNISPRFINNNTLTLKIRNRRKLIVESLIQEQRIKYEDGEDINNKNKQKKIGEVVEKVALWRKFYTGFYDQFGNYIQKPLETAAQEVGIAKKTLDDYLLQIRNGKKYGFNFNEKTNAKIGELRAFVRDQKKKEQK